MLDFCATSYARVRSVRKLVSVAKPGAGVLWPYASSHYWARELIRLGHEVKLMPGGPTWLSSALFRPSAVKASTDC